MGISSFEVNVESKLLAYAINSSGYTLEGLANEINKKKKSFNFDYLKKLINGEKKPLLTDLEKLDSFLKRGLPFFLLGEIPKEERILKYRKKSPELNLSPATEVTLREYNFLREEIDFLLKKKDDSFKRILNIYSIKKKAYIVSNLFRKEFNFDKLNIEKTKPEDVFKFLREKIEEKNIFIFKNYVNSEKLDDNLRGCIFLENSLPPLILINSNDDKNAEIYTLLHEFAHYLLNKEELDTDDVSDNYNDPIEKWCNEFAYSFLINEDIEKKENFTKENFSNLINSIYLRELSKKYKVSKYAFMYRFLLKKIISLEEYYEFKSGFSYKSKINKEEKSSSSGGNYYATRKDKFSKKFISLVFNSYKNNTISLNDAFNYLGVKDSGRLEQMAGNKKE